MSAEIGRAELLWVRAKVLRCGRKNIFVFQRRSLTTTLTL